MSMNKVTRRKYIIIPDFKPLYAAKKCFAPDQGPLTKPTPMPVDIIRELLMQSGKEKLTIYEVVIDPVTKRSSEPVLLTLDNYQLPYEEIAGQPVTHGTLVKEPTPPPAAPVVVPTDPKPVEAEDKKDETSSDPEPEAKIEDAPVEEPSEETPVASAIEADAPVEPEVPAPVEEAPVAEADKAEDVNAEAPADENDAEADGEDDEAKTEDAPAATADPYAGMTKAERKAARRAAAQNQKTNEG